MNILSSHKESKWVSQAKSLMWVYFIIFRVNINWWGISPIIAIMSLGTHTVAWAKEYTKFFNHKIGWTMGISGIQSSLSNQGSGFVPGLRCLTWACVAKWQVMPLVDVLRLTSPSSLCASGMCLPNKTTSSGLSFHPKRDWTSNSLHSSCGLVLVDGSKSAVSQKLEQPKQAEDMPVKISS